LDLTYGLYEDSVSQTSVRLSVRPSVQASVTLRQIKTDKFIDGIYLRHDACFTEINRVPKFYIAPQMRGFDLNLFRDTPDSASGAVEGTGMDNRRSEREKGGRGTRSVGWSYCIREYMSLFSASMY